MAITQYPANSWVAYAPAWTATGGSPAIGTGSLVGRYLRSGNLCHVSVFLGMASSTTVAGTSWRFSLPVPAAGFAVLPVFAHDVGTAYYHGVANIAGPATTSVAISTSATANIWGSSLPFSWTPASGDYLYFSGTYEC